MCFWVHFTKLTDKTSSKQPLLRSLSSLRCWAETAHLQRWTFKRRQTECLHVFTWCKSLLQLWSGQTKWWSYEEWRSAGRLYNRALLIKLLLLAKSMTGIRFLIHTFNPTDNLKPISHTVDYCSGSETFYCLSPFSNLALMKQSRIH